MARNRTNWKALARRRGQQLAKAIEALEYAQHQSDRRNQLTGIEDTTYFAWIHDKCRETLKIL
jgi:hypothetical protein